MNPSKAFAVIATLVIAGAGSIATVSDIPSPENPSLLDQHQDILIDETFNVSHGDDLLIDVNDANIIVETSNNRNARVQVHLTARDMDRARTYFETLNFEVTQRGSSVVVTADHEDRKYRTWQSTGGANIVVEVQIPSIFNVNIKTSDGDITLEDIEGEATVKSSDGDLRVGSIEGKSISLKSSDGDILADHLVTQSLDVSTSDGDIKLATIHATSSSITTSDGSIDIEEVTGKSRIKTADGDIIVSVIDSPDAEIRTSDGDVVVDNFVGEDLSLKTSDGDITASNVSGAVSATTSDGDIRLAMDAVASTYARASDGNVYIEVPRMAKFDIQLKAEQVRIDQGFNFQGTIEKRKADGAINGGGSLLQASTSSGHIILSHQ